MTKHSQRPINLEEYVFINGIQHFFYHLGTSPDNPVLLFLHGGPGWAQSLFTTTFQEKWEEIYTVVHWDQRGAGKTLTKNPRERPTMEILLQDLFEIVQYLKKKYSQDKIVLLGHSWGSVLGSVFIQRYPEDIDYYIGVGQVIHMVENERVGYNKLKEMIEQSGDEKSLRTLETIGEYPGNRIVFDQEFLRKLRKVRKLQGQYQLAVKVGCSIMITAFKSPIFRVSDLIAAMKNSRANVHLYQYLGDFKLHTDGANYPMPIYYILGSNDWQTPYVIAEKYFEEIEAPHKALYIIPEAGHMTMMDQPRLFFETLREIHKGKYHEH